MCSTNIFFLSHVPWLKGWKALLQVIVPGLHGPSKVYKSDCQPAVPLSLQISVSIMLPQRWHLTALRRFPLGVVPLTSLSWRCCQDWVPTGRKTWHSAGERRWGQGQGRHSSQQQRHAHWLAQPNSPSSVLLGILLHLLILNNFLNNTCKELQMKTDW